jgi:hypothetical protein
MLTVIEPDSCPWSSGGLCTTAIDALFNRSATAVLLARVTTVGEQLAAACISLDEEAERLGRQRPRCRRLARFPMRRIILLRQVSQRSIRGSPLVGAYKKLGAFLSSSLAHAGASGKRRWHRAKAVGRRWARRHGINTAQVYPYRPRWWKPT